MPRLHSSLADARSGHRRLQRSRQKRISPRQSRELPHERTDDSDGRSSGLRVNANGAPSQGHPQWHHAPPLAAYGCGNSAGLGRGRTSFPINPVREPSRRGRYVATVQKAMQTGQSRAASWRSRSRRRIWRLRSLTRSGEPRVFSSLRIDWRVLRQRRHNNRILGPSTR